MSLIFILRWSILLRNSASRSVFMVTCREVLERLKTLREERDLRQEYIAKRIGVDRTTYVRKEGGKIPISTDEWLKLSEAMDVDPAVFFRARELSNKLDSKSKELLLVKLYSILKRQERKDLIRGIDTMFKDVRRKNVQEVLEKLRERVNRLEVKTSSAIKTTSEE